jgi:hypothetical protein
MAVQTGVRSLTGSPEQAIRWLLLTNPVVAKYIGSGIYPLIAAPSERLPFLVYQRQSATRTPVLQSMSSVAPTEIIEVSAYAETYAEVREVARSVRAALDGYTGNVLGTKIEGIQPQSENEDYVSFGGEQLAAAYQITMTFTVQWQETT